MQLLLSLQKDYESKIIEADFQIKLFTTNPLAVAGHSNHAEVLDKWIKIKAENTEKLKEILTYLPKPDKPKKDGK